MTRATWSVLTQEEKSESDIAFRFAGVSKIRGITQFTWIIAVFSSRARLSVRRLTPDLPAELRNDSASPRRDASLETFTIFPRFALRIAVMTALHARNVDFRFNAIARSNSSSVVASTEPDMYPPIVFTRTSIRRDRLTTSLATRSISPGPVTFALIRETSRARRPSFLRK